MTTSKKPRGSGERKHPTPKQIVAARGALTQTQAAALIYCTLRAWQDWEGGQRRMHPAFFELFELKMMSIRAATPTN
jgi:hypothetical protein